MPEAGDNYTPSRGNAEQTLTVLLAAGRLPHALLLYGERGLGKRTLCRRIAAVLLCERGPNADGPCLSCPACHKVAADTHPDVITVAHSGKQQGFSVETLRELCADAYIRPNEADYKVYILADCDSISAAAQNTLLKLLEEPPTGVFFFLTAESRAVFLPTILSRLTAVPVPPMTEADCRRALTARGFDDPAKVNEAVEAFGGNIGRCLDALEHPEALEAVQAARAIASAFAPGAWNMRCCWRCMDSKAHGRSARRRCRRRRRSCGTRPPASSPGRTPPRFAARTRRGRSG